MGHIHSDIFNEDKLMNNGVEVTLRFVQSRDGFALMDPTGRFRIVISVASLYIQRVKTYASVLAKHSWQQRPRNIQSPECK